jgi:hypothetical protein
MAIPQRTHLIAKEQWRTWSMAIPQRTHLM